MSNFWDVVVLMASTFVFIAYLMVLFQVVVDLFRDSEMGGGSKVLWIIGLIFLPVLTALIYVLARGSGMAERQRAAMRQRQGGYRRVHSRRGGQVACRPDRRTRRHCSTPARSAATSSRA